MKVAKPPLPAAYRETGADERTYTYTIITTNSAKSVSFLHDRMPVILEPESEDFKRWLDPNERWSVELANILKPYEGDLLWYLNAFSALLMAPVTLSRRKSAKSAKIHPFSLSRWIALKTNQTSPTSSRKQTLLQNPNSRKKWIYRTGKKI